MKLFDKVFLLANSNRDGLLQLPTSNGHVVVGYNKNGDVQLREISSNSNRRVDITLREIGQRYLNLNDDSVSQYLISPEMEVERIFNAARLKYLKAIHLSNIPNPKKYLHYRFNKPFQALAGLKVYQGNAYVRQDNDAFWQDAGFSVRAKEQNWQKEQEELRNVLMLLKRVTPKPVTRVYAELIAIKPGFHELYLHRDYFDDDTIPTGKSPRDQAFRMLRNREELSMLALDDFPPEMNKRNYCQR